MIGGALATRWLGTSLDCKGVADTVAILILSQRSTDNRQYYERQGEHDLLSNFWNAVIKKL